MELALLFSTSRQVVAHACNHNTWEVEAGGSDVHWHPLPPITTHTIPEIDLLHQEGRSSVFRSFTAYCIVSSFQQGPLYELSTGPFGALVPLALQESTATNKKLLAPPHSSKLSSSQLGFMFCGVHSEPGVPRARKGGAGWFPMMWGRGGMGWQTCTHMGFTCQGTGYER